MTEAEWLACRTSRKLLAFLRGRLSERKALLIGCACCRLCWSEVTLDEFRYTTEVLERMADGVASADEIAEGERVANYALDLCTGTADWILTKYKSRNSLGGSWAVRDLINRQWSFLNTESLWDSLSNFSVHVRERSMFENAEFIARIVENLVGLGERPSTSVLRQSRVVRDIFGNPFRPVSFSPPWRTTDVMLLARGIYEDRAFDRMPILADALQDAGCENDDVLNHCRDQKTPHVRGCWVIDLVLGK